MNQSLVDYNYRRFAPVAQWTERRTSNPQVVRSIRTRGTFFLKGLFIGERPNLLKIPLRHNNLFEQSTENFSPPIFLLLKKNTTFHSEK